MEKLQKINKDMDILERDFFKRKKNMFEKKEDQSSY